MTGECKEKEYTDIPLLQWDCHAGYRLLSLLFTYINRLVKAYVLRQTPSKPNC